MAMTQEEVNEFLQMVSILDQASAVAPLTRKNHVIAQSAVDKLVEHFQSLVEAPEQGVGEFEDGSEI